MKSQTKFTAFVASSIDGRIAKDGQSGTDWTSKEDWNFFQKSLAKMDPVIVGHNTYLIAEKKLKKRNTIVFTSKVDTIKLIGSVFFLNPEGYDVKKFLRSKNYKKVGIIGGPQVYNFCLSKQMLDELFVTIEPYIFTTGVPMFSGSVFKKYKFILQSVKKLNKKGTLLLKYKNAN
ncbi:MAG TPA: dihydrofolate reductase [Candidatus Paceibacterota bacterium]|jgi:dihydrofolate reductase|nr:dihydrofolate reductase [Candidatus Paceibacterota bacterium]